MAISVTTPLPGRSGFILNGTSADASGCEELMAAPGAGKYIVVDKMIVNCGGTALSITIGEGEAANAVVTALIGPIAHAANSSIPYDFTAIGGMRLSANTSLTVDASAGGAITVFAVGRIV